MIVRGAAATSSSGGPWWPVRSSITLKDLVRATRPPLTAKQISSADQRTHAQIASERANGLGVLSVRLGASAQGFRILSLSIHSTASLMARNNSLQVDGFFF